MKCFYLILFLISCSDTAHAGDTLREQDSFMYSKYFVLEANGSFDYVFHHCNGTAVGTGSYIKSFLGLRFKFDEVSDSLLLNSESKLDEFQSFFTTSYIQPKNMRMKTVQKQAYRFVARSRECTKCPRFRKGKRRVNSYYYSFD
jgi:hypothetical protein